MIYRRKLYFILFVILIGGPLFLDAKCGTRLRKGTLICNIGEKRVHPFKANLCTHASVEVYLKCENEVCTPVITSDNQAMIEYFEPNLPLGLHITVDLAAEDYLKRRSRRVNTVKAIVEIMKSKGLSFTHFLEQSWVKGFKNEDRRNYLDLIEEMAEAAHNRDWHVGMIIDIPGSAFAAKYDLTDLSEFVDIFILTPRRQELIVSGKFFLGSWLPLTSENNESGTLKHALEFIRPYIKPECLIVQIEMSGKKYVPLSQAVDAGPGSLAEHHYLWVSYNEICRKNLDLACREYWDTAASTPFSACSTEYFSYDNMTSIRRKVDLIKTYNVVGLQANQLINDDHEGVCGLGPVPQLKAMQGIRTTS